MGKIQNSRAIRINRRNTLLEYGEKTSNEVFKYIKTNKVSEILEYLWKHGIPFIIYGDLFRYRYHNKIEKTVTEEKFTMK